MPRRPNMKDVELYGLMALTTGDPGAVNSLMQSDGQSVAAQDSKSEVELPRIMHAETRLALEEQGVVFIGPKPDDNLFVMATIPDGWSFKKTNHYMYTDLLDSKGRKRASIMYKPEFYDRDAKLSAVPRFRSQQIYDDPGDYKTATPAVFDGERLCWRGTPQNSDSSTIRAIAQEVLMAALPIYKEVHEAIAELQTVKEGLMFGSIQYVDVDSQLNQLRARALSAYWDDPTLGDFPPNESEPLPGEIYTLHVRIINDGRTVDSGDNTERKCTSDDSAKEKLIAVANRFLERYDQVEYTIRCGSRVVDKGMLGETRKMYTRDDYDWKFGVSDARSSPYEWNFGVQNDKPKKPKKKGKK